MIVDTLGNIGVYFGMSQELNVALSVLKNYDLSAMAPGEYHNFPVDGYDMVLKILEPDMVEDASSIPWEYHREHVDVQCVLKGGSEIIGYTPRNKLSGWEYHEDTDTAYSKDNSDYLPLRLEEYDFAIFFPQDAHRKLRSTGAPGYRKLVMKVPVKHFHSAL